MKHNKISYLETLSEDEKWSELAVRAEEYIQEYPQDAKGWFYAGKSRLATGNYQLAFEQLNSCLKLKKVGDAELFFLLGQAYEKLNSPLLADDFYSKACKEDKKTIKYQIYRVVNLYNNKLFEEIKEITPTILKRWQDFEFFPLILMTSYEETQSEESTPEQLFSVCSKFVLESNRDDYIKKYIDLLIKNKKFAEIDYLIKNLSEKNAKSKIVHYAEGKKEENLGNIEQAKHIYKQAGKDNLFCLSALIELLFFEKHTEELIETCDEYLNSGQSDLEISNKIALAFAALPERKEQAIKILKDQLKRNPNSSSLKLNLGLSLLEKGNLEEGWKYLKYREGFILKRKFLAKEWKGEDLTGKTLMVCSEQGVGDYFMYATCFKDLMENSNAKKIVFETDPRLISLFQRTFPNIEVRKNPRLKKDSSPYVTDYDFYISMGNLTSIYRKKISDFTGDPYLVTNPELDEKWQKRLDQSKLKIGLIWRSGFLDKNREKFYVKIRELEQLFNVDLSRIEWVNLQYGDCSEEISYIMEKFGVDIKTWEDLDLKDDFENTASLIKNLDLVIGPGTAPILMAGALGVPAWMYSIYPEWSFLGQKKYPWFNSIKMYLVPFPTPVAFSLPVIAEDIMKKLNNTEKVQSSVFVDKDCISFDNEKHYLETRKNFLGEIESECLISKNNDLESLKKLTSSIRLRKRLNLLTPEEIFLDENGGEIELYKSECITCAQEEQEISSVLSPSATTTIVIFSDNRNILPFNSITPYVKTDLDKNKIFNLIKTKEDIIVNLIYVRDIWEMWYQVGPLGSCLHSSGKSVDKWLNLIKKELTNTEKLICIGRSAGASAAIQFGAKLNADAVVAISPQARPLDGEWELENGDFSFLEEGGNWRKQVRDKFNLSPVDLKPYADELGDKLHIIVPKLNKTDITHADYLTQNNRDIQQYRSTGKNHGEVNNELILDIIKKLI